MKKDKKRPVLGLSVSVKEEGFAGISKRLFGALDALLRRPFLIDARVILSP